MNVMTGSHPFPAKLLLFGEYTVLTGSRALAWPLWTWSGRLSTAEGIDPYLSGLAQFLQNDGTFDPDKVSALMDAVQHGMCFISDIPQGYGVGSSGALCAAIYDRFFRQAQKQDLTDIRQELARMEGFFHGQSSGMDPLVSMVDTPVLREAGQYHSLSGLHLPEGLTVFLIDSKTARNTSHLVDAYLSKTTDDAFVKRCLRPMIQSVDHAISFLIDRHVPMLWEHIQVISLLQFEFFGDMIHDGVSGIWEASLGQPDLSIKLCGAGGGGFYLGFARGEATYQAFRAGCGLRTIRVF